MIEFAIGPGSDRVTARTGCRSGREVGSDVIRNVTAEGLRFVPIRLMTRQAVRGVQRVIVVDVAGGAGRRSRRHVRANKRETGDAVIKRSRVPTLGRVALGTIRGGERSARR